MIAENFLSMDAWSRRLMLMDKETRSGDARNLSVGCRLIGCWQWRKGDGESWR